MYHLNPITGGVDGLDPIKIGEVSKGLYCVFTEVDALEKILHGGISTKVAAVLLIVLRDCLRKFSSISPKEFG